MPYLASKRLTQLLELPFKSKARLYLAEDKTSHRARQNHELPTCRNIAFPSRFGDYCRVSISVKTLDKAPSPSPRSFLAAIVGAALLGLLLLYVAGFAKLPAGETYQGLNDARLGQSFPVQR